MRELKTHMTHGVWVFFLLGVLSCAEDSGALINTQGEQDASQADMASRLDAKMLVEDMPLALQDQSVQDAATALEDLGVAQDLSVVQDGAMPQEMGQVASQCQKVRDGLDCPYETGAVAAAGGFDVRTVYWQKPLGEPPEEGWPVVIYFQGSGAPPSGLWRVFPGAPFGAYYLLRTIKALLDAGFVVVAPEARYAGTTYWDTNISPFNVSWTTSTDHQMMERLFVKLEEGDFGQVDMERMHAMGISSGGYMTSRMALAYPGRFKSLAVASASWATCAGSLCSVPQQLPVDHPPTLFLHGAEDAIVPVGTMEPYASGLMGQGTAVERVVKQGFGHEWLPDVDGVVRDWFKR